MRLFHLIVFAASMLVLAAGACPARGQPSDVAQGILDDDAFDWQTIDTPVARIHFEEGSFAAARRDALAGRVKQARADALQRLGLESFPVTLDVFYVDSRQQMEQITGYAVTGLAYRAAATVVLVYNAGWRAFERHEFTHVITSQLWGAPGEPAPPSLEGMAVYADGRCGGYDFGRVVRGLDVDGALLSWRDLTEDFRSQDDLVAYLEAGSMVAYAVQREGTGVLEQLWKAGLGKAPDVLGTSPEGFYAKWHAWLEEGFEPPPPDDMAHIRKEGCGITP